MSAVSALGTGVIKISFASSDNCRPAVTERQSEMGYGNASEEKEYGFVVRERERERGRNEVARVPVASIIRL